MWNIPYFEIIIPCSANEKNVCDYYFQLNMRYVDYGRPYDFIFPSKNNKEKYVIRKNNKERTIQCHSCHFMLNKQSSL